MMIATQVFHQLPHAPTSQQHQLVTQLEKFVNDTDERSCFILKGYAGTGKTTVLSALVNVLAALKINTVLLAPTGRAAKVIQEYSGKAASTIHRKIYRKKSSTQPDMAFNIAPNAHKNTFFIVDEASMISNDSGDFSGNGLLDDLIRYVYNYQNNRIIFVGDTAQLPPVHAFESPALSSSYLAGFSLNVQGFELTEVVRQTSDSGILHNATQIRKQITEEQESFPKLNTSLFKDCYKMGGDKIIEGLNYAYDKYGIENCLVICRSNKSANIYNQHIRNQVLWREDEITGGDLMMVVKNNYFWLPEDKGAFIANGEIVELTRVKNIHEMYGFRFADVQLKLQDAQEEYSLDCKILLDTIYEESPNLSFSKQKEFYNEVMKDYEDLPTKRQKIDELKTNPYYNALQVKFAYAVTCHKAQGGQWDAVFVDQGFLTEEMINIDLLRWLYTASTRAQQELFYINFHEDFFKTDKR